MKKFSETPPIRSANYRAWRAVPAAWLAALSGLASVLSVQAYVLDNFNGATLTGWTVTSVPASPAGSFTQTGGQLNAATAAATGALTYGSKNTVSYANQVGQTLEFRVDVNGVVPGGGNVNPVAILAWLPSGVAPGSGSSGYSVMLSAASATLMQGSAVLATTALDPAGYSTNFDDTTLVLRMTPTGVGNGMTVNARIYRQTSNQPLQSFTEVWETTQSTTDTTIGTLGYASLGVQSGANAGATITFDNLQDFPMSDSVLDNFTGGSTDINNYAINNGGPIVKAQTSSGSYLELQTYALNTVLYVAASRKTPLFQITDGARLEFSVDIPNQPNAPYDPDAFASLTFSVPQTYGVGGLVGYHVACGSYGLSMGKAYGEWWANQQVFPDYLNSGNPVPTNNPGANMRLILNLTGEGTSCRIEGRIENLNVGINDPDRVLYQNVFVDTIGVDPLDTSNTPNYPDGTGLSPLGLGQWAYTNVPGNITMYAFYGGSAAALGSDVQFNNLTVNQTPAGALPPAIINLSPPDRSNFVAVANSAVSFTVNDNVNISSIALTLNGVTYTGGSGATLGGTPQATTFTLNNPLPKDTFYSGKIVAVNSVGGVTELDNYSFDTFTTNDCFTVESEDYNFTSGGNSGQYIDATDLYPNGSGPWANGYVGQVGTEGIDYHDARTSADNSSTYRPLDNPRTATTGDGPRGEYLLASANWATLVPETILVDRQNGDWNNYTHTYSALPTVSPIGTYYTAYMRMSQYNVNNSVMSLQQVTSDPTQPNQTAYPLGVFLGTARGYDINFDVPLTDAFGNLLTNKFPSGVSTLRVNNDLVNGTSSQVWQNYVVFAPAGNPGSLPPYVSDVLPAAGQALGLSAPLTNTVTIVNRTTTVNLGTVAMTVNGSPVPSTTVATANGAMVTWTPVAPTAVVTNSITFKDSASFSQTFTWTNSYSLVLQAANALPVGSLTVPGLDARIVVSSAANMGNGGLGNSVASAQTVLTIPPPYAVDLTSTNLTQSINWGILGTEFPGIGNYPGLCAATAYPNSFAVEAFAYLQLTAGLNRFWVDCDDTVGIFSGANLADTSNVLLETTGVVHESFDFFVPAAGLYPFNVIYQEGGGSAYLRVMSMNVTTSVTNQLNAVGGVPAYYPLIWRSATSVKGPYTADAAANAVTSLTTAPVLCDGTGTALNQSLTGGTNWFPVPVTTKFYRLDGPRATDIKTFKKVGSNLSIGWTGQ